MFLFHFCAATAIVPKDLIPVWIAIGVIFFGILGGIFGYMKKFGAMENQIGIVSEGWKEFREDIKSLIERVARLEGLISRDKVTTSNSPRVLNDVGRKMLKTSGIGDIVDGRIKEITEYVKSKFPENAYQIQKLVIQYVSEFGDDEELKGKLETGAFESGFDVQTVLYVGAIYIRDKILPTFDYIPADVDQDDPDKKGD